MRDKGVERRGREGGGEGSGTHQKAWAAKAQKKTDERSDAGAIGQAPSQAPSTARGTAQPSFHPPTQRTTVHDMLLRGDGAGARRQRLQADGRRRLDTGVKVRALRLAEGVEERKHVGVARGAKKQQPQPFKKQKESVGRTATTKKCQNSKRTGRCQDGECSPSPRCAPPTATSALRPGLVTPPPPPPRANHRGWGT